MLPLISRGSVAPPCLVVAEQLCFEFVPFEISHFFHFNAQKNDPMRFIVSCADRPLGCLPHPYQISAGNYKVDRPRACTDLTDRVLIGSRGML